MNNKDFVEHLKQRLFIEFKKQTASMFDTGTLYTDDPDIIFRTKDIEEMNGHFKMFNYIMKNMDEPLSEDLIKGMHKNLKEGVFEDFANGYAVGEWKKRENRVSDIYVALPQEVPEKIHQLLNTYTSKERIELKDVAVFHAKFENIHPFQDDHVIIRTKLDKPSKIKGLALI